jgi:polyphosphate kinase
MNTTGNLTQTEDVYDESTFDHRELSQLAFFKRVLAQATQSDTPLLEKLRFLTICSAILDEFFEIRVAGLKERLRLGIDRLGPDGLSSRDVLFKINQQVIQLLKRQYSLLNNHVLPQLAQEGITILKRKDWQKKQKAWVKKYFRTQVFPVLTPVGLDPSHPFPQVLNKSLNVLLSVEGDDAFGRNCEYAVLHVPRCLPRVIPVPRSARLNSNQEEFVLLSSVIHVHAGEVFPGMTVTGCHQFRVTRHADLAVDEEEVEDLLDALKGELTSRSYGESVRLEVATNCPQKHVRFLLEHFHLGEEDLYKVNGPVNLNRLATVVNLIDRPDLKYPVFVPQARPTNDIFELLQRKDLLLHHPFQSFSPVVELIKQAAADPDVLAIKQTVYRTGKESPFIDALIEAARAGKEVTAIIELKARFDEEANINIASRLQAAGAHVVYGVVGYKTHAKLLLIIRREGDHLRRYCHLGTGNYHTGTARLYTDFSLLTSNEEICIDVHTLFQHLTGLGQIRSLHSLIQAPFHLSSSWIEYLDFEAKEALAGRPAKVMLKVNSLSDPLLISALYKASQAGVEIDLIIRGICCLKPGIPGVSETIKVRSVVGRFLEHSRVYYFHHAGQDHIYLSSADLMQRNLYRRVEVAFPIRDQALKSRILKEAFDVYLDDVKESWILDQSGSYYSLAMEMSDDQFLKVAPTKNQIAEDLQGKESIDLLHDPTDSDVDLIVEVSTTELPSVHRWLLENLAGM